MYAVVTFGFQAGDHVPVMPFDDVAGSGDEEICPAHDAGIWIKAGVTNAMLVVTAVGRL